METVLRIDPAKDLGPVRRMNGVGGGPVTYNFSYDATAYFREARIPFSRTHDIEYPFGSGEFVDIHNLFPDFDKDENDPASYNFTLTDEYLKRVEEAGAKPLFRLGNSIEHQSVKRHILPPADFDKWGRVCSRVIAHYNEGWGNGLFLGIEYWEIWNEPDIPECWTGTQEQILELYESAARIIKREHPGIKIGGLAFANTFSPLIDKFLSRCRDHHVPLDFVSWHQYVKDPAQTAKAAKFIRAKMDEYGFGALESVYDEWNYVMGWGPELEKSIEFHHTVGEAAFMGAVMSTAQENGVDIACYYDVQLLMGRVWNGVFAPGPRGKHENGGNTVKALPGFYALKYWGALYGGNALGTESGCPTVYAAAAISEDRSEIKVLLSNFEDRAGYGMIPPQNISVKLDTGGAYAASEAWVTDSFGSDAHISVTDDTLTLRGYAVALVTLKKP